LLTSVKIERFKNISEININLEGINLLIGGNNAGKSSIQQAIQFAVSVAQSTGQQNARWEGEKCPSSLSSETLLYSPLKDIEALAPKGKLLTDEDQAIKVTFTDETTSTISIRKGKNKNIATKIEGKLLGLQLQNIENPYSMFVPGLAGIPAYEEYKPPSVVRKAAAKGDSNSVFRNVLLLLSKDQESWASFKDKFKKIFIDYEIIVSFDPNVDENIDVRIKNQTVALPIDSCGTGILQAIQILSYYYLYKPKVLILDEPDSHLHPNNQRVLAVLLKNLNQETGCQILISTHSKHLLEELKADAKVLWVNKSSIVEGVEDIERNMLLDMGALDKGDLLRNGDIPCIFLTEDTNIQGIKILAESSGFLPDKFQIWSYNGCSNTHVALAMYNFIKEHAVATQVVVHRDRDFMTDAEVTEYKRELEKVGINVFVTQGNDTESHFINERHISFLYPRLTQQQVKDLINESLEECHKKILEKYINTIYERRLQKSYRDGIKPNAGKIADECNSNVNANPRDFMHGKIVEKNLRNKIQQKIGGQIIICRVTDEIRDPTLMKFANKIWPDSEIG